MLVNLLVNGRRSWKTMLSCCNGPLRDDGDGNTSLLLYMCNLISKIKDAFL